MKMTLNKKDMHKLYIDNEDISPLNKSESKKRSKYYSLIKAIWAALTISIGLALIIVCIPFQKNNGRHARKFCRFFFPLNNVKVQTIGEYDLNATMIVLNHQSLTDIICMEGLHPLNICWVAKKELGEIPFYGWALKGPKMILIDREDKRGMLDLMKEAKDRLAQNRPLAIFPEGTRGDGREFLEFKSGGKVLAERFKLRIQPIVLVNTRAVFNSKPLESLKNEIRIVLMPSFVPSELELKQGEDWYKNLRDSMREVYKKHYEELN